MSTKNKGDILAERIEDAINNYPLSAVASGRLRDIIADYRKPWTLGRSVNGFTLGDGQEWHRNDWTEDMLPEGWRPMLLNEQHVAGDEYKSENDGLFYVQGNYPHTIWAHHAYHRTRRPLPTVAKLVPLGPEDVPPGSAIRVKHSDVWRVVLGNYDGVQVYNARYSYDDLHEHYEISRDGGKTWQKCQKEVK